MGKSIPKSRLNISYRTRIDGRAVPQKLPLRLLVLADFHAGHPVPIPEERPSDLWTLSRTPPLENRRIKSLKDGATLKSFMTEMQIAAPIMKKELESAVYGDLEGEVELKLKQESPTSGVIAFRGLGTIEGQPGRHDNHAGPFKGRVLIEGELNEEKGVKRVAPDKLVFELPQPELLLWGVVTGEVSGRLGRVKRERGQLVAQPQATSTTLVIDPEDVPGGTEPPAGDEPPATVTVEFDDSGKARARVKAVKVPVMLTIPITDPSCFRPEYIANRIPEIHRLMVIKTLLTEMRTYIANNYAFGDSLRKVITNTEKLVALGELTTWLAESFPDLAIEPSATPGAIDDAAE